MVTSTLGGTSGAVLLVIAFAQRRNPPVVLGSRICAEDQMILEAALLHIRMGENATFETTMAKAQPLIAASPGFVRLELRPWLEHSGRYLLLVWWEHLEDHTTGFRCSDRYQEWKRLLHHFYDPFPEVEHFGPSIVSRWQQTP